jgi:hypothetical protein
MLIEVVLFIGILGFQLNHIKNSLDNKLVLWWLNIDILNETINLHRKIYFWSRIWRRMLCSFCCDNGWFDILKSQALGNSAITTR